MEKNQIIALRMRLFRDYMEDVHKYIPIRHVFPTGEIVIDLTSSFGEISLDFKEEEMNVKIYEDTNRLPIYEDELETLIEIKEEFDFYNSKKTFDTFASFSVFQLCPEELQLYISGCYLEPKERVEDLKKLLEIRSKQFSMVRGNFCKNLTKTYGYDYEVIKDEDGEIDHEYFYNSYDNLEDQQFVSDFRQREKEYYESLKNDQD